MKEAAGGRRDVEAHVVRHNILQVTCSGTNIQNALVTQAVLLSEFGDPRHDAFRLDAYLGHLDILGLGCSQRLLAVGLGLIPGIDIRIIGLGERRCLLWGGLIHLIGIVDPSECGEKENIAHGYLQTGASQAFQDFDCRLRLPKFAVGQIEGDRRRPSHVHGHPSSGALVLITLAWAQNRSQTLYDSTDMRISWCLQVPRLAAIFWGSDSGAKASMSLSSARPRRVAIRQWSKS